MAEWIINVFNITDPKLVKDISEQVPYLLNNLAFAAWETIYSTVLATFFACLIGLPLGVILIAGEKDGIRPLPSPLMKVLNVVINLLRSVPFLILMVVVFPLSRVIVGTSIGTVASIVPLTIAAAPFVARLVEGSLREMDRGTIEAAQAMGCTPFQIIWKVLLPECLPSLLTSFTTAFITMNATLVMNDQNGRYSTVDVASVDLHDGSCEFVKLGASYTFIKREQLVETIQMETMPIGLFQKQQMVKTERKLESGDYVIMVSDGVLAPIPEEEQTKVMENLLLEMEQVNPKDMANGIMEKMLKECNCDPIDDMTVLVFGVWKK